MMKIFYRRSDKPVSVMEVTPFGREELSRQ